MSKENEHVFIMAGVHEKSLFVGINMKSYDSDSIEKITNQKIIQIPQICSGCEVQ